MKRQLLFIACALALASSAVAQTKVSGTIDCDKADPMYTIPIPDRPGFVFSINQNKCIWSKGGSLEGLQAKELTNTTFVEVMGESARSTATGVTRYDNGDTLYTHSGGTSGPKALTSSGKWTVAGGTGKLLGAKGGGTYTCKIKSEEPGAGYTCDVEGSITLAAAKE
jgi:hypothetical protein